MEIIGTKAGAAEEGQDIGKLNAMKTIMEGGDAQTYDNAAEHAHLQSRNAADRGDGSLENIRSGASILQNFSGDF